MVGVGTSVNHRIGPSLVATPVLFQNGIKHNVMSPRKDYLMVKTLQNGIPAIKMSLRTKQQSRYIIILCGVDHFVARSYVMQYSKFFSLPRFSFFIDKQMDG